MGTRFHPSCDRNTKRWFPKFHSEYRRCETNFRASRNYQRFPVWLLPQEVPCLHPPCWVTGVHLWERRAPMRHLTLPPSHFTSSHSEPQVRTGQDRSEVERQGCWWGTGISEQHQGAICDSGGPWESAPDLAEGGGQQERCTEGRGTHMSGRVWLRHTQINF